MVHYSEPKPIVKTLNSFYSFLISNRSHGEKLIEPWKIKRFHLLSVHIPFRLAIPSIESIEIIDNGIGFTDENRESFDTLYSDYKIEQGGKGFGRFTCLKYFDGLHIDSNYFDVKKRIYSGNRMSEVYWSLVQSAFREFYFPSYD